MTRRICICGGGALGHVIAGVLATFDDCEVTIFTRRPNDWHQTLSIAMPDGKQLQGTLLKVSANPIEVISEANIVLLCLPGFAIEETLRNIKPYVTTQYVGSVVCSSGFFFRAHEIFDTQVALFGFQRVPFISRVIEYGKAANLLGYRSHMYMACEKISDTKSFAEFWTEHFNTPVSLLENYLEVSLTNSNPLLHPSRLYGLWHDWHKGVAYPHRPLFYKEWDDFSSKTYINCDQEFQQLTKVLGIHITDVLTYYESFDARSMTQKFQSIQSLSTIQSPMKQVENGWIPDFKDRYFTEDFPYGLQIIKDLALKNNINTPTIDKVLAWGNKCIGK